MSQSGVVLTLGFLESQGKAPEAVGGGCFEVWGDILQKATVGVYYSKMLQMIAIRGFSLWGTGQR